MIFEQHYLGCLSQASYLIGDESTGRAAVVDPRRDVSEYLEVAAQHGLTIELVLETHFHADFLSGHLELAAATGATIGYGSVAEPEFEHRKFADGEKYSLGEVTLEIRHTPGHTPESISIVVWETADAAEPHSVLTGDTLFVGDVGRPDLLTAVGASATDLAGQLYDSIQTKLLDLPDATKVYPGHGAGSACGKSLSSDTWSTIGDQKSTNYALQAADRDAFVQVVTEGQTAPPAYFGYDGQRNREAREILNEEELSTPLSLDQVLAEVQGGAVVLDTREPDEFARGHLSGAINVGLSGRYAEFVGGILAPTDRVVIVAEPGREGEAVVRLARIGYDNVIGHLDGGVAAAVDQPDAMSTSSRLTVADLVTRDAQLDDLVVLDVRQPGETEGGIIPGAVTVPLTLLNQRLAELDPAAPTVVYCAGGFRSMIASSRLEQAGFADVSDLIGGYGAWEQAHESQKG